MRKSTKELALCSMLAALSVVLLCLGGIVPLAVSACPMLASGALLAALFTQLGDSLALILALRACQN